MKPPVKLAFASLLWWAASLSAADLPPMPEGVSSFGAVVCDSALYTYGGHRAEPHSWSLPTTSGSFRRLDLQKSERWEDLPAGVPVQSPGLAASGGKIYQVGGMQPQNTDPEKPVLKSLSQASIFDPATRQWTKLPDLPEPRSSHEIAILDGKLYVVGGWPLNTTRKDEKANESKPGDRHAVRPMHDKALVLDLAKPEAGWRSFEQPFQRRALAVVACGGKIYALGGMDAKNQMSAAVDVYEPASGKWSSLPELPTTSKMKGFAVAACEVRGEVIASPAGGHVYALRQGQWEDVGTLQQERFFHRIVPWGQGILSLGGNQNDTPVGTIEVFDLSKRQKVSKS